MTISSISVSNFQRISDELSIELGPVTILVGENGAGKSSIIKAVHWAIRCATLKGVEGKVTLEQMDYVPSKNFLELGHKRKIQNSAGGRRTSVKLFDDNLVESFIELSAARNEAGVNVSVNGPLIPIMSAGDMPKSAFIPGLAGLAEEETILATPIMHRKAASGEGGSVLRQVLLELAGGNMADERGYIELTDLSRMVASVLPGMRIWVKFDRLPDRHIDVRFVTEDMLIAGQGVQVSWKSIEMAGTGFLQVVQIFAYFLYFRPRLPFIDEPDAHLHPSSQKLLMKAILQAAKNYPETQIIISTHSAAMVSCIDADTKIHWIADGSLKVSGEVVRNRMGWSVLDKDVLLISQDSNEKYIASILSQWPELEARCAVWPTFGRDSLPDKNKHTVLSNRFGGLVLLHRDRDFMSDNDVRAWVRKRGYDADQHPVWVTPESDMEAEFCRAEHISVALGISSDDAAELIGMALANFAVDRIEREFADCYNASTSTISQEERTGVIARQRELSIMPGGLVRGKILFKEIRRVASDFLRDKGLDANLRNLGKLDKASGSLAISLREFILASLPEGLR